MRFIDRLIKNDKIYRMLMLFIIVMFTVNAVYLVNHTYKVYKEDNVVDSISSYDFESFTMEDKLKFVETEGNIDESLVDYALMYYFTMPENLRLKFKNDGWRLILTDKDIQETYYNGSVKGRLAGLSNMQKRIIYVHGSKSDIRRSLIHEFGHYVDYINDFVSNSEEFENIFNLEKDLLIENWKIDNHNTSSSTEFFAEVFNKYILYNDKCMEETPEAYRVVDACTVKF